VTFDPFHVDLDGVLGLSRAHADAAAALDESTGSALAKAAGIDAAHGSIGTRVSGAFGEVLGARHDALKAASHTSGELSDRLGKAVSAYARGDECGAESVRAAAEAMGGGVGHGASGTPIAVAAPPDPGPSGTPETSGTVGAAESSGLDGVRGAPGQGVGASVADSDLASRSAADEPAERLTRE
jgi:hypothetical protein